MIYFSIFFSLIFFIVCSLYLFRVKVSDNNCKDELFSQGKRLIIYAGLLLVSLQLVNDSMNLFPMLESTCQELLSEGDYDGFDSLECKLNDNIYSQVGKSFFESLLAGLSWLVPFIFASVGVNVLSQGVLMQKTEGEFTEEQMVNKLWPFLHKPVKFLLKGLP